ncbi:protein phosphatase 2C domain-containing protein [Sulfurimonas sp. SAG-AH-194-I05]|nr:PP2C family serine/threonine-protein phosphatase [Sulfurimonas sp. SAG-AH-194-I05]MDF1876123.1 protein phosphatase 2C domain-containing protein [Sulfurimonas sp. SAG-AH-194-I05]
MIVDMIYSNYKVASATRQGVAHLSKGIACQDKVNIVQKEDFIFLGLADGAGSALYCEEAAEFILVRLSIELDVNRDKYFNSEDTAKNITMYVEYALYTYSIVHELKFEELASTLLCVVLIKDIYLIIHVGDGVIASINQDNELVVASEPENDEEFCNYTVFVNTVLAKDRVRVKVGDIQEIKNGVLLCSDGIEGSIFNYQTNEMAEVTRTMINWLDAYDEEYVSQALALNLKSNFSKLSSDDLSIIIMKGIKDESI